MSTKLMNKKTDMKKNEWMEYFSFALKARMEYLEMTQNELAKRSGVSQFAIWTYLNCRNIPSAYNLSRLATALICSPNDLVKVLI